MMGKYTPLAITPPIFQNNRELIENHFVRSSLIFVDQLLNCQVHVELAGGWGRGGGELGQKSKPGERGEAYFSFSFAQ